MLTSECKKILAVAIDNKFNFNNHLQKIIKEANQKVYVWARTTQYMRIPKRKLPLVWICHSRLMNNKVNQVHERCLRIPLKNY